MFPPRLRQRTGDGVPTTASSPDDGSDEDGEPTPAPTDDGHAGAAATDTRDRMFRLALALGLAPLAVSAVAVVLLVGGDYHPTGDLAMTEMHIRDVGRHEVLIGLHSRPVWSHLGPLQFYVVAPFYWLSGNSSIGMVLGALAINGASLAGILTIARRRGGTPLLLCTLVASLLLMRSLGPEFLGDAWNLTLTVLPFALLAFVTWSMFSGEAWALPLGALVTSFLIQTHVSFAVTAGPLFACGVAALGVRAWRGRDDRASERRLLRAAGVSVAVLAVVWLPPVVDGFVNSPSNASRVVRYFRDPGEAARSLGDAWRVTTGQFGLTSEWLTGKLPMTAMTGESPYLYSSPLPVLLVPLLVAAAVIWRRGRDGRGLVIAVALVSGLVGFSILRTVGRVADYRLRYTWVPPVLAAVVILWAAWLAVARRWPRAERPMTGLAVVAASVLAAVTMVSAVRAGTPHADDSEVASVLSDPVIDEYADAEGAVVVDDMLGIPGPWYSRTLVLQLERHGIDAQVPANRWLFFSPSRVHDVGPVAARLLVATGDDVETLLDDPDLRLLSRWTAPRDAEAERTARRFAEVLAERQAGEISDAEYMIAIDELSGGAAGPKTNADDVAVFVDERRNDGSS